MIRCDFCSNEFEDAEVGCWYRVVNPPIFITLCKDCEAKLLRLQIDDALEGFSERREESENDS